MTVEFHFEHPAVLKERNRLKEFIISIFKSEKAKLASLTYIFCSDEYLLNINRQFLNHDYYTDIITFNLSHKPKDPVAGEIYISVDRVKDNASIEGVTQTQELHRVIIHGVLHLSGYKDKTKQQKEVMRNRENFYLKKYGLI